MHREEDGGLEGAAWSLARSRAQPAGEAPTQRCRASPQLQQVGVVHLCMHGAVKGTRAPAAAPRHAAAGRRVPLLARVLLERHFGARRHGACAGS